MVTMSGVSVGPSPEEVRAEMEAVLGSALFVRSPRLSRLLRYLCTKALEGTAEDIKEYQIGVDVLGRPDTFDPTEDAAARVEVHRLRKRLRDFYETEGQLHRLRIEVPLGRYAVVLQPGTSDPPSKNAEEPCPDPSAASHVRMTPTVVIRPWHSRIEFRLAVAIALAIVIIALAGLSHQPRTVPALSISSAVTAAPASPVLRILPTALAAQGSVRIACGRTRTHTDRWGEVWDADRDYQGGTPFQMPRQFIARAYDPKIYQAGRTGNFTYTIPLSPGIYELHLYFLEGTYGPAMPAGGGEISRVFDVLANGKPLLSHFDIYSDAGGSNIADVRVFKDISPGPEQVLTLKFQSQTGLALVNAIELTPAIPHRLNPVRIVAQDGFYTDSSGAVWKPDHYYSGGQTATHSVEVHGTADPDLFLRERYGHFDYAIPVDKGSYQLTLYFAEEYFGPGTGHGGQAGTRVFDVSCNGLALLREFDILKGAGPGQALVKTFHGLAPNGQGTLLVSFAPIHDYASVYALEVLDESN